MNKKIDINVLDKLVTKQYEEYKGNLYSFGYTGNFLSKDFIIQLVAVYNGSRIPSIKYFIYYGKSEKTEGYMFFCLSEEAREKAKKDFKFAEEVIKIFSDPSSYSVNYKEHKL